MIPAISNATLVKFFADLARGYGREIATRAEARQRLGLPVRDKRVTRIAS